METIKSFRVILDGIQLDEVIVKMPSVESAYQWAKDIFGEDFFCVAPLKYDIKQRMEEVYKEEDKQ